MHFNLQYILTILFLFATSTLFSQVTYKWRYYTASSGGSADGYYSVAMPSDSANGVKRPVFVFFPGAGETGSANTTEAKATLYGTSRDLKLGYWNGGVLQSNGYADSIVYPIYLTIQNNAASGTMSVALEKSIWEVFTSTYGSYIDTNQLHIAGLSLGGRQALMTLVNSGASALRLAFAHQWVSGFIASAGGRTTNITDYADEMGRWAKKGGRLFYTTGKDDITTRYDTATVMKMMNDSVAGSAIGRQWELSDGFTTTEHGGWDTLWRYNRHWWFLNGLTPFEWQLQFTKTPKAVAQSSISTSDNSVTLNGVSNGWYKSVAWTKVSGGSATITNPSKDTTTVTGLSSGAYVFRMTVTNQGDSRTATHDVTVSVGAEPESPPGTLLRREKVSGWKIKN